ncbi:MAG: septation protein SepH [Nocardioidaceae bacterium]
MRKLKLVGLSADGRSVVFVDDAGAEFAAPADDRLRAALRGDRPRLGQLEIEMDSALRPRDIQARIRAGESAEAVAVLAQVSVDKIMPFCVPVLAERQHIAALAQRSHVRRKNIDGPSRRLSDVVAERLRERGVSLDTAGWDAWRRDDGRWAVQATYHSGERERTALFVFDSMGRFSLADDDEAKWLTGEQQSTRKGPQPRQSGAKSESGGSSRRLSSVPTADHLLDADDQLNRVASDDETSDDLTAVVRALQDPPAPGRGLEDDRDDDAHEGPAGDTVNDETGRDEAGRLEGDDDRAEVGAGEAAEPPVVDAAAAEAQPAPPAEPAEAELAETPTTEPTRERRRRGRGRASVPSWDEIMFGKGKDE